MAADLDDLKAAGVALASTIIGRVETRARKFLDDNAGSREFVAARAKRYGELSVSFLAASSDTVREIVSEQMAIVLQSIENELAAVAVDASVASREEFQKVLVTVLETVRAVLPIVLSLI